MKRGEEPSDPEAALDALRQSVGTRLDPACYDALTASLDGARPRRGPRRRVERPAGLTDREIDVLRQLALGHSNRQIAAELVISGKTVERHLENIYGKLGVSSRTSAVVFAVQHGVVG